MKVHHSNTVYLSLGSNIGDRESYLQKALQFIDVRIGKVIIASRIYNSSPWGNRNQNEFLNQVIRIETTYSPQDILSIISEIEKELNRVREHKWAARTLDIDILFFNSEVLNLPNLSIPHPLLHERKFVLIPMNEIAPTYIHPVLNKTICQLLNECKDSLSVISFEVHYLDFG